MDLPAGPRRGSRAASNEDEQAAIISVTDRRLANLRAALGFLHLAPRAPELRLLHRWLDTWTGLCLMVVGVERQGLRFSLTHLAEGEWESAVLGASDVGVGGIWRGGDAVAGGVACTASRLNAEMCG